MLLKNRAKDPKALIRLGMLALLFSIAWPRLIATPAGFSEGWMDGVQGALLGIAIGLIILAARFGAFNRRQNGN